VHLSDDLLQRVRAYALRTTPYPIATKTTSKDIDIKTPLDEQFEFPELSHERGQLLQALVLNKIDPNTITFRRASLEGLDLSRAYMASIRGFPFDLKEANLARADLFLANLTGAELIGAELTGAKLFGANLSEAKLFRADFTEANLTGAILKQADLTEANLDGADLTMADLTGANFNRASLTGAQLKGAILTGASFTDANLSRANLEYILGQLKTNDGRTIPQDAWLRSHMYLSKGLDKANLPKGIKVSCSVPVTVDVLFGNSCSAVSGWTITYEDQPRFEDKIKQAVK
jgi:uncharacterized protein YjbI with pentapeptide repeats